MAFMAHSEEAGELLIPKRAQVNPGEIGASGSASCSRPSTRLGRQVASESGIAEVFKVALAHGHACET